ncbi:hypothetical protein ACEPAI_1702 [Sanghuangporus weigelae]
MFVKLTVFASLALLAVATPMPGGEPASSCSTAPIQCCDSVQPAGSDDASKELGLLGIIAQGLDVPIGLTCTPVTVVGTGSSGCSANPVCCEDNSHGGLVAIGCVPVDLSL